MRDFYTFLSGLWLIVVLFSPLAQASDEEKAVEPFIDWLLLDGERMEDVRFAQVVKAVSACEVLPVDVSNEVDELMLRHLSQATEAMLFAFENPEHIVHQVGRINEVSRPIEDFLLSALNAVEGMHCTIPLNASGEIQRSGYPDLRFEHTESGRVFYIDPKVYKAGSETSSFRTFYFEPKKATNKILDDASHLILAISHTGKLDGCWQFEAWQMVDLVDFRVRLKAEFQASNRELYREEAVLRQSKPAEPGP
jgi:hypothetical protein